MAAGSTYTPIATTTLSSAAATYTFTSIPSTYTDLVIIVSGKHSSTTDNTYFQVGNGTIDTGTNYSRSRLYGYSGGIGFQQASNDSQFFIGDITSSNFTSDTINLMNYSNTSINKTALIRSGTTGSTANMVVGLWRSLSAINTIKLWVTSGTFTAGSTFTLYGITAA